tara:strand:+ start:171 stop:533 length:363 start_codon:yes stop_codon:yes gene_type:complete
MSTPLETVLKAVDSLKKQQADNTRQLKTQIDNMLEHLLTSIENNTSANLGRSIAMNSGKQSKVVKASSKKKLADEGKCGACKQSFKFENSFNKYHIDSDGSCKKLLKEKHSRVQALFIKA